MSTTPAFVSRLVRLPLTDADGDPVGRIRDVVFAPSGDKLRVLGLVANIERRNIFINMSRVAEIDAGGVRMIGGTVSVRSFSQRSGEQLAVGDLFDTRIGDEYLTDLAIAPGPDKAFWYVVLAALGRRGPLRRRAPNVVPWEQVASHFASTPDMEEVAELRDLHPTDVVNRLQSLSLARRQQVVALLADEQVADLLEEMPEEEAVRLVEGLDLERAAHILEEMEPDDAADLLADLAESERAAILEEMRPEESIPLRRLLAYDENTAGGLMTPEPVILSNTTSVAEALASIRAREIPAELAAQVFVTQSPVSTPTGRFVGVVGFQRLLREAPSTTLEECVSGSTEPVAPDLPLREVAERLASYDLLALPVCDRAGRLVGAVTVDDVLDHVLPEGWRRRQVRP
ncbi:magnesium transporter MgtE N-terminal domain-containing protein [Aquihabitans sp. McL0605]|uniref:magnesium transporter MgtE N-terminal domain-containing protein n=1 Tax=Aquihabitans sp. McL0605 TaxID=3415671 RepID=UPI003CF717A3